MRIRPSARTVVLSSHMSLLLLVRFAHAAPKPSLLPAVWQEPGCTRRIAITLPASRQPVVAGVVCTGADFYRWTGYARPATGSLSVWTSSSPLALQVEERDSTGRMVSQGNGVLDDDDRLVFAVTLLSKPQLLHFYYDGTLAPRPAVNSTVHVVPQPGKTYSLVIKNGDLTVGLRGGGVEPTTTNRIENHGRGSMGQLIWQGLTLAEMGGSWGNYIPQTLASGPGAPVWSEPTVVCEGPVRTVVEVHCDGYVQNKDGQETFRGSITHYLSFWSGCSIIDFEELADYTSTTFEGTWPYSFHIPVGKDLGETDRLIVPLIGKAYVVELKETKEHIQAHPWRGLYTTDNQDEGWFAVQDPVEKTGLATFYEPMRAIEFRQSWITYRPALHPYIHIRTTPYNALQVNLSIKDRALRCRSHYRRELRYIPLRDETPEDIRELYHLWGKPLERAVQIGWPEVRSGGR